MKSQNQHDYASKLLKNQFKKCEWLPVSMVFHMSQPPLLISMTIKPAHHQRKCTQHEINHHKSATAIEESQSK